MTRNADGTYGYGNEDARRRRANEVLLRYLGNIQKTKTNYNNEMRYMELEGDDAYNKMMENMNRQYTRRQYMGLSNG